MDQKTYDLIHKMAGSSVKLPDIRRYPKKEWGSFETAAKDVGKRYGVGSEAVRYDEGGLRDVAKEQARPMDEKIRSDWEKKHAAIDALVTPEIKQAVETFGLNALVAKVYGVADIDEKIAVEIIGHGLVQRRAEYRDIFRGLQALKEIE